MNLLDHLDKLQHFIAIEDQASIKQTSLKLNMTQGALSKSIAQLESAVGTKLLVRSREGVSLTAEGQTLMIYAKEVLKKTIKVQSKLQGIKNITNEQNIRLGVYDSIAVYFLPKLLNLVSQIHPGLSIDAEIGASNILQSKIDNGELDICLGINLKQKTKNVVYNVLFQDHYSFYIRTSRSSQTNELPLIWFPEATDVNGKSCKEILKSKLKSIKTFNCSNMETVKELTLAGIGVGILPTRVAQSAVRDGRLIECSPFKVSKKFGSHEVNVLYRKDNLILNDDHGLVSDIKFIAKAEL